MTIVSILALILSFIALQRNGVDSARISVLEKKVRGKDITEIDVDTQSSTQDEVVVRSSEIKNNINTEDVVHQAPYKESAFMAWLKEDWLLKLGGVLVLMGVLFFLSVAFTAVGPQGKVSIGYIFGATLMVSGFMYARKQCIGGSAIHVVGAIIVIITTYTARLPGFNLLDSYFAMLLMFMTSTCVALTAFAYKRVELAHVGVFMSLLVPVLVSTGSKDFFELLMYLCVVTIGVLVLAVFTEWRTLVLLSLVGVFGYSVAKIAGLIGSTTLYFPENYFVVVFGILFYVTSIFSILRSKGKTGKIDGYIALFNACFAITWIFSQVSHEMTPIVISLVGLCYAVGLFVVYKVTNVYTSFIVYGGVAVGLVTTAIIIELSGRTEAFVVLLLGGAFTCFTYFLSRDEAVTRMVSLFHLLSLGYVARSILAISYSSEVRYFVHGLENNPWSDMIIVATAIVIYFLLYYYLSNRIRTLAHLSLCVSFVLTVVILWQGTHLLMENGFATFLSILIYTVLGLLALLHGTQEKNETKVKLSRVWLVLVAARVIFWDAWQTGDVLIGVLICVVIGVLLLSSAFIIKKVATE